MSNFEQNFNPEQLRAVTSDSKATLVIAGAGSGKTRVIIGRVLYLNESLGVEPDRILVITFTNKAARELKHRLSAEFGAKAYKLLVSTFHAFCVYIINSSGFFDKGTTILDQEDQLDLISRIIKQNGLAKNFTARNVASAISKIKNAQFQPDWINPLELDVYRVYQKELQENCLMDFDDLMLKVCEKAERDPIFVQYLQRRFRHVLIDEYQDTNFVQHKLIKLIALLDGNLAIDSVFAVGDQDQSIYSWRGALVTNITDFKKDFAPVKICKLERNYRSSADILGLANQVIKFNKVREDKNLWTNRTPNGSVLSFELDNEWAEAQLVIGAAKAMAQQDEKAQLVVLLRANYQSRVLEEKLIERGLSYKIYGGVKFYERKEIKDCLAFLKLCVNPFDTISFSRIINVPTRGFGAVFVKNFLDFYKTLENQNLFQALSLALSGELKLNNTQFKELEKFFKIFDGISGSTRPEIALQAVLERTQMFQDIVSSYDKTEAQERCENINELLRLCQNLEINKVLTPEGVLVDNLVDFLNHVALVEQADEQKSESFATVIIMTIHSSKGLEFQNVAVIGLTEGSLPHKNSSGSLVALEEECRLLYVAITRAKDRLLLTHTKTRNTFDGPTLCQRSRFLTGNPDGNSDAMVISFVSQGLVQSLGAWLSGGVFCMENAFMEKRVYTSSVTSSNKLKVDAVPNANAPGNKTDSSLSLGVASKCPTRSFRRGSVVEHVRFGKGVVSAAAKDDTGNLYLTVNFKGGEKKLLSTFVKVIE